MNERNIFTHCLAFVSAAVVLLSADEARQWERTQTRFSLLDSKIDHLVCRMGFHVPVVFASPNKVNMTYFEENVSWLSDNYKKQFRSCRKGHQIYILNQVAYS